MKLWDNDTNQHFYTMASVGLKKDYDESFFSREAANALMYNVCSKNNLEITNVYDDKHTKTYICKNGVRFFISRV